MTVPEPTNVILALICGSIMGWLTVPHCFGMCGPLHLAVCLARDKRSFATLSLFNVGRIIGYTLLGAVCGLLGDRLANFFPKDICCRKGYIILLFPAAMFLVLGIRGLLKKPVSGKSKPSWITKFLSPDAKGGPVACGVAASFLPCGPLYAAFVVAVGTRSPILGSVVLLAFCGTISFALQLGIMVGTMAGKKLGPFFNRAFPWICLCAAAIYVGLFFSKRVSTPPQSTPKAATGEPAQCPHCVKEKKQAEGEDQ